MARGGKLGSPCSRAAAAQAGRVIVVPQTVSPGVKQMLVVSGATLLESVYDALQEDPGNLQVRDARNGRGWRPGSTHSQSESGCAPPARRLSSPRLGVGAGPSIAIAESDPGGMLLGPRALWARCSSAGREAKTCCSLFRTSRKLQATGNNKHTALLLVEHRR